jgi:uncharacterized protein GlcG (DUF336 family)
VIAGVHRLQAVVVAAVLDDAGELVALDEKPHAVAVAVVVAVDEQRVRGPCRPFVAGP